MKTYRQFLLENGSTSIGITAPEDVQVPTQESLEGNHNYIDVPKGGIYWIDSSGLLSRDDGPAVLYKKGRSYLEVWCIHGMFHRGGDEPAIIQGNGRQKQYWVHGLRHRDNRPALFVDGQYNFGQKHYYHHGIRYVPGKKERVVEVEGGSAVQRVDGTLVFREKNVFYDRHINADTEKIVRPDGSVELYDQGTLKEIESKNDKNYNFVAVDSSRNRVYSDLKWKNAVVCKHYQKIGSVKTNFSEATFAKFFLQLGLESFLEVFNGMNLSDDMKWSILKQDVVKAAPLIPDYSPVQQEYIIQKRPDLIGQIQNLDPALKAKYQHETELGGIDL